MANLGKVIYINEEDYSTLLNGGSITKGGTTYTYDSTALYVIKDVSAPEYAETAGYATTAGEATKATQDGSGNNIVQTYATKEEVPTTGADIEYTQSGNEYYVSAGDTINQAITDLDTGLGEHGHGNINSKGQIVSDTVIANGDKLVVTDASSFNTIARASLTFDGSTTTQALTKKGTFETFYQKPSTGIPASDLTSAVQTSLGKADTSVQKITSTDNAIARYDGTGGQIQNSGVTIDDSNHVTAAKFITSGGTSSQFVKGDGSLDSGYYIKNGDYIINTRAALENNVKLRLYDRELQDCFWAANIRFVATHKVYNNSDDSFVKNISTDLFKGSYESWNNIVTVDQYAILYLGHVAEEDLLDNASTTNSMAVYPSGRIILQFYTSKRPGEILEAKGFFRNDTNWRDLTVTTNNSVTYFISVPNVSYLKAIRIKYSGSNLGSEGTTSLTDVSFIRQRDDIASRDIVTKYPIEQTLYGNVTAPKFITRGGTSSQFVKGNGSLDSTTYTPQTAAGANSLLSSLHDWTATPTDTTKLVRRDTAGGASFGQVTFLTVWNYIKSKISSVLGIGGDNGVPTAPTAASGTNTTQIATTAFVQNALSNMGAGGSEMVDVTITGTTSAASFSTNPYNAIKAVVDDGKIAVLNANVDPLSTTGVLIPVYEYTYSQSGSDFTGYKGKIQNGNYEISVDVQSTSSATVSITSVGSSITVDTALSESSTNPVQNRVITAQILENEEIVATALNNLNDRVELKQDQLVSGTTIKTINNQSILGSGNISISGGGGGGGGEENVIEVVKVNGTALTPDANKAVNIPLDSTPTANSGNAVTSGGIKSYVDGRRVVYNISFGGEEVVIDNVTYYGIVNQALADAIIADVTAGKEVILADGDGGYNRLDSVLWGMYLFNTGGVKGYDFIVVSDTSSFQGYNILYRYATSYQERLVSGTNIKTINSQSLLGSGNISVGTYSKPSGGIPATDLASAVQTSLGKADTSLQPDVDNDLGQGTISSSNSQGFDYIIANKDTSSEQTLQDALDAKASISAVNAKYTKPAAGIPDTDLTTAVNVRLLAQLSSSSDDGKIMKYSYSAGSWQAVKPVTIYSGSSAPSSSTGSNGDIYIQTS